MFASRCINLHLFLSIGYIGFDMYKYATITTFFSTSFSTDSHSKILARHGGPPRIIVPHSGSSHHGPARACLGLGFEKWRNFRTGSRWTSILNRLHMMPHSLSQIRDFQNSVGSTAHLINWHGSSILGMRIQYIQKIAARFLDGTLNTEVFEEARHDLQWCNVRVFQWGSSVPWDHSVGIGTLFETRCPLSNVVSFEPRHLIKNCASAWQSFRALESGRWRAERSKVETKQTWQVDKLMSQNVIYISQRKHDGRTKKDMESVWTNISFPSSSIPRILGDAVRGSVRRCSWFSNCIAMEACHWSH